MNTVDGRILSMIQEKIDNPWPDPLSTNAETRKWGYPTYALAALYMNQDIQTANDYINAWYVEFPIPDSATIGPNEDFKLNLFWRMYLHPETSPRLNTDTRDNIEAMMWNWINKRSLLSDAQASTWNYHGSENHDAMQKVSFLMCSQALKNAGAPYGPDRTLNDGGTLAEHAAAWTDYFIRYFRDRAREGIHAEIACPTYAKYTIGVYHNIHDFSESVELRELAVKFLNLYWTDTAIEWLASGVRGGGETRCYKDSSLRKGAAASFPQLLWGYGWPASGGGNVHPVILHELTSTYRVPEIVTAIASDTNRPNHLYTSRRWGLTTLGKVGEINYVAFDNGDSHMLRETWITPDYAMGTITFDMNRDYLQIIDQNRAMGVMFASGIDDRVMIFGHGASSDNKSYADLSGVTRENCLVAQRDKNANNSGGETRIFVPASLYDNRVENGGWLFLQSGNAYCAVRPADGGYSLATVVEGADYDLQLGNKWSPVIIQMGQAADYTDFADFQNSVSANVLTYASGTMNYTSEAGDTFTFYANTKTTPKMNGTTVNLNPTKTYDSPYLSMVHGEESATVSYTGYPDLVLDFGSPPSIVTLSPADDSSDALTSTNLVATFSEPVVAGTGSIVLHRGSDDSVVETFDVESSPRIAFNGSDLTIDPTNALEGGVEYYVLIDPTAIEDALGNPFAGISDSTAWSFTTDGTPPAVVSLSPPDDSSGMTVGVNLTVTFDEPVQGGSGLITIHKTIDNSVVESFDAASSPRLSFAGVTLTIDPTSDLDLATSYYVTIDSSAVEDLSGNPFAGLAANAAWNFTTSDGTSSPIAKVNDGNFGGSAPPASGIVSQSISVGAGADMLVVMTACEIGGLSGNPMTVTYGGVAMNMAVGNLTSSSIWYLDLTTPGITGTNVVVDMSGYDTRNGFAAGWVSIDGNLGTDQSIALHSTGTSASQSNTVDLTTTAQTFNAVNFNGNSKSGTITVNSPNPTVIYTDTDIGSARSAAAYVAEVDAATSTYEWTLTGGTLPTDYRRIDAAAFAVVSVAGGNNYSDWIALYPGVGAMTGINQDPDGDGNGNGVENFFGTAPDVPSRGMVAGKVIGNTFSFTHPQNPTAAADLTAAYRWSKDLVSFHADGAIDGGGTKVDFSSQADTPTSGITTVTAAVSGTPITSMFVTVEVSGP